LNARDISLDKKGGQLLYENRVDCTLVFFEMEKIAYPITIRVLRAHQSMFTIDFGFGYFFKLVKK